MSAVDRASEIIRTDYLNRYKGVSWGPDSAAEALAAAGLLMTDEVSEIVECALRFLSWGADANLRDLNEASATYLATRGEL